MSVVADYVNYMYHKLGLYNLEISIYIYIVFVCEIKIVLYIIYNNRAFSIGEKKQQFFSYSEFHAAAWTTIIQRSNRLSKNYNIMVSFLTSLIAVEK